MEILKKANIISANGNCQDEIKHLTIEDWKNSDLKLLHDIIRGPHVSLALEVLRNAGFFDLLLPEIQDSLSIKSDKKFKEIWPHTLTVVNNTPNFLNIRWAAFFHDLGKAKAFEIKNNKVTFHNHEYISAQIFKQFAFKTRIFSQKQRDTIYFLVKNLGYIESYENSWTDSAVRRFAKEAGPNLDSLFILSKADITTANPKKRNNILNRIESLKTRIQEITQKDQEQHFLPKGLGNVIAERLNIPLGPEIGKIRSNLENLIKSNVLLPNQSIEYYLDFLLKENSHK